MTLARAADLHEKHTVHRHLEVLHAAGLLVLDGGAYRLDIRLSAHHPDSSPVAAAGHATAPRATPIARRTLKPRLSSHRTVLQSDS